MTSHLFRYSAFYKKIVHRIPFTPEQLSRHKSDGNTKTPTDECTDSPKPTTTSDPPKDPPEGFNPKRREPKSFQCPEGLSPEVFRPIKSYEEQLGPNASKADTYKNPEYFAYHRFSFYEAQRQSMELREERIQFDAACCAQSQAADRLRQTQSSYEYSARHRERPFKRIVPKTKCISTMINASTKAANSAKEATKIKPKQDKEATNIKPDSDTSVATTRPITEKQTPSIKSVPEKDATNTKLESEKQVTSCNLIKPDPGTTDATAKPIPEKQTPSIKTVPEKDATNTKLESEKKTTTSNVDCNKEVTKSILSPDNKPTNGNC